MPTCRACCRSGCRPCDEIELTCLVTMAMARTSNLHGNVCEPLSFVLKNPARCSLPSWVTYSVAPNPGLQRALSVTIHNWLLGLRSEIGWAAETAVWLLWNEVQRSSVHRINSLDSRPATVLSICARSVEHPGMAWESTLNPQCDPQCQTQPGAWGEGGDVVWTLKVPEFQPSLVLFWNEDWWWSLMQKGRDHTYMYGRFERLSSSSRGVHVGCFLHSIQL